MDELNHREDSFPLLSPGTILSDRYEILYVIGEGGCGRVYKARDVQSHDKIWAVKEIFSVEDPSGVNIHIKEIFQREGTMLSALTHKNIPKIKEYFINEHACYIVMEYIEGKTLQEIYKSEHRLWSEKELAKLAISLCDVLEYLHERSVVFRDVKTKNIIIDEHNVPKLIDFGIARHFRPDQAEDTIKIGTVGYAAPEQYGKKGGGSDRRTDIYALGVLLHYLATGDDPEEKDDPFKFTPVREVNSEISEDFQDLIERCIKFRKDERFVSVREIKKKLQTMHYQISSSLEKYEKSPVKKRKYSSSGMKNGKEKYYTPSSPPDDSKIVITQERIDDYVIKRPDGENDVKITLQGNERYIINLPPEGITLEKAGTVLFMTFWLTGWTVGGIVAITSMIKNPGCFLAFWLCGWAAGETIVTYSIIATVTSMLGRVRISFDREYMKIKIYWFGLFPVEKIYAMHSLSNPEIERGHMDPFSRTDETIENKEKKDFLEGLSHVITVKSEEKKINIPFKKTDKENEWLYREIRNILDYLQGK